MTALARDGQGVHWTPTARGLYDVQLHDGVGCQPALLVWMPGPGSYTREDVAEWHVAGNEHLVRAVLERLLSCGVELAAPGEFTRRSYLNGRLDLTRAEGVLALIEARNREEVRAAGALLGGGLARRIESLRDSLDALQALTEASLDFDETDTGHVPSEELLGLFDRAQSALVEALGWERRRNPASGLARVVLAGKPNAGKSALLNALVAHALATGDSLGRAVRSIESDQEGTTRDVKEVRLSLPGGQEFLLVDTAGIEGLPPLEEDGGAAALAQERRHEEWARADVLVTLVDARKVAGGGLGQESWLPAAGPSEIRVLSQVDRWVEAGGELPDCTALPDWDVSLSSHRGWGLDELLIQIETTLTGAGGGQGPWPGDGPSGVARQLSLRHVAAIEEALEHLGEAASLQEAGEGLDLVAEALRASSRALDSITGETTPENLLDRIFARFCLGK